MQAGFEIQVSEYARRRFDRIRWREALGQGVAGVDKRCWVECRILNPESGSLGTLVL